MPQEKTRRNVANFDDFDSLNNIPCNTVVHLQILTPTQAIRLKTRLIGVDPNMSVILAVPREKNWVAANKYMCDGQGVILRIVSLDSPEANLIAFRTSIQRLMSIAGNWLVLDYPKGLEKVSLRKFSRIPINIEGEILEEETQKVISSGFLNDISINGCAFTGQSSATCVIGSQYTLCVNVEAESPPLVIPVIVRNISENEQQQYGLAFQKDSQETQAFIQKIITHHLSVPFRPM